ncbi:MAG: hypothetical protein QXZ17_12365 [Nitrososphaerota archaeon]
MPYVDSNVFLFPVIYRAEDVEEARRAKSFLLKIARGEVEAYTSTITILKASLFRAGMMRKVYKLRLYSKNSRGG